MIVRFTRGHRVLGEQAMDAVPRGGEAVTFDREEMLTVWNVTWEVCPDEEPVAWVSLKTRREYERAAYGRGGAGPGRTGVTGAGATSDSPEST